MSELLKLRTKRNLTQEELAERSGVSVRTIQRIETGAQPKGYTLKALAKAMEITESELLPDQKAEHIVNSQLVKFINLSSLLFVAFPPVNVIAPVLLTYYKKQDSLITRQIATVQLLWTLFAVITFLLSVFIRKWFALNNNLVLMTMTALVLSNVYIILRNTYEIDRSNSLYIKLRFNII